jgi:hypothetical protein
VLTDGFPYPDVGSSQSGGHLVGRGVEVCGQLGPAVDHPCE